MTQIFQINSSTKNLRLVEPFLHEFVQEVGMETTRYHNAVIALTEAVNNAIVHGNNRDESKIVTITSIIENDALILYIDDAGTGFNPDELPDPLAPENILRDCGRGVFLMRSLMDSAEFFNIDGGSRTLLRTKLRDE